MASWMVRGAGLEASQLIDEARPSAATTRLPLGGGVSRRQRAEAAGENKDREIAVLHGTELLKGRVVMDQWTQSLGGSASAHVVRLIS